MISLTSGTSKTRWAVIAAVTAALVTVGVSIVAGCGGGDQDRSPGGSSPTVSGTAAASTASPPAPGAGAAVFPYQPLWPFRSEDEASAWQDSYRAGGHQPWHLDADETALSFSRDFLGFTDIDRVIIHQIGTTDAHVSVGLPTEGGRSGTAAAIHLVRFGAGPDAPWEVVGTRDTDTDFSLTTPAYGATVSSPVTVGGTIVGVDETIRVQVRQPSSDRPLGDSCCGSAGGTEGTPWSASVSYSGATDPVLTVVASTGGHLATVERFTVTGVRPAARPATP